MKEKKDSVEKRSNFIWDMDGTLIDSYSVIVTGLSELCREYNLDFSCEEIKKFCIQHSVWEFYDLVEEKAGINREKNDLRRAAENREKEEGIPLIPYARETLEVLKKQGCHHFIYTHRGNSTLDILTGLGVRELFDEIVTSENGLPRKPAPDGILYLVEKHGLRKEKTYYVGDRTLDMDAAKAAGVNGILYLEKGSYTVPNGSESIIVNKLTDILSL